MQPSLIGLAVCAGLLLFGRMLGAPLIVALIVSLAFGSTAVATLGAVGGSSPLIYMVFAVMVVAATTSRQDIWRELCTVFVRHKTAWVVCALTAYAICGALLLPRLFSGWTSAFVPMREQGLVVEVPLKPVPGNFTQTAYFTLGAITFLALSVLLLRSGTLVAVRKGFFAWATVVATSGIADLLAKIAGGGDIFLPIRTATFAMITGAEQAGFWRIAGLYSEASSFGGAALSALAFSFVYWKTTGARIALLLTLVLLTLVLLSTSSTAYVGLACVAAAMLASMGLSLVAGRIALPHLIMIGFAVVALSVVLSVLVWDRHAFESFEILFRTTILEKSASASGIERAFWNQRSLQSFLDTFCLGVGLGSSRSSNWVIAVLSQLGLAGAVLQAWLVIVLLWTPGRGAWRRDDISTVALHDSVRAAAATALLTGTIAGGAADPGLQFFVSLATVLACRSHLRQGRPMASRAPHMHPHATAVAGRGFA